METGLAEPPELAEPVRSRRISSMAAEEGKSILRMIIPYGLLRVLQISIILRLSSAGANVSEAFTNKLPKPAALAPKPPGKRARPFEPLKPRVGWRVSRKFLRTPFSTRESGWGAKP